MSLLLTASVRQLHVPAWATGVPTLAVGSGDAFIAEILDPLGIFLAMGKHNLDFSCGNTHL